MNLFHRHEWEKIGKYYETASDGDGSMSYKCYILYKCLRCPKEKSEYVVNYYDIFYNCHLDGQNIGSILGKYGYVPKHIFELKRGKKIK
jgi:hypothetical protein